MTVAAVAIAAALTMTACSSDGDDGETRTTATQASTTVTAPDVAPPTAAELNDAITQALDPAVPVEQKIQLVQGAEKDPELVNQVAQAAKDAGATIEVKDVTPTGADTVTAGVVLTVNGQPNDATVDFVSENGVWKMSQAYACQLVAMAQLTSPACPA